MICSSEFEEIQEAAKLEALVEYSDLRDGNINGLVSGVPGACPSVPLVPFASTALNCYLPKRLVRF